MRDALVFLGASALLVAAASCGDSSDGSGDGTGSGGAAAAPAAGGSPSTGGQGTGGTGGSTGTGAAGSGGSGGEDPGAACGGGPPQGIAPGPDLFGCPTYPEPVAADSDPPGCDTWDDFAGDFFTSYCVRCHSTENVGAEARNFAPAGYDWDDAATVRSYLQEIRGAVGVQNFMPPSAPEPSCDERLRLIRWIDLGAP